MERQKFKILVNVEMTAQEMDESYKPMDQQKDTAVFPKNLWTDKTNCKISALVFFPFRTDFAYEAKSEGQTVVSKEKMA